MDKYVKPAILPLFTLAAGLAGLLLRFWLFAGGLDVQGLLPANHPATVLGLLLTAVVLGVLYLCVRPLQPVGSYAKLFPAGLPAGIGSILAAAGLVYMSISNVTQLDGAIAKVALAVSLPAAVCLVLVGVLQLRGNRPHYLLHAVVTVSFMLQLLAQYGLWSNETQLPMYLYGVLASVFLMLTAYHRTVLDARKGSRRWYVFCNQAALFFCCVCLRESNWLFYLAMVLWLVTSLCTLTSGRSDAKEAD